MLVTFAGFGPGPFQEQANFFTMRANTLTGVEVSRAGWPPEANSGFCGGFRGCGLPAELRLFGDRVSERTGSALRASRSATAHRLGPPAGAFATLFFVPPTCDATACLLVREGRVALTGDDATMLGVNVEEGRAASPGSAPEPRAAAAASTWLSVHARDRGRDEWGITAVGYGTFAASTPGPNWLPMATCPVSSARRSSDLDRDHTSRHFSTLRFAPAIAVLYGDPGKRRDAADPFPRPY